MGPGSRSQARSLARDDNGEHDSAFPRRGFASESYKSSSLEDRGRRECRALAAPAASWAEKGRRPTSKVTTGKAETSGTPCAMALRLTPRSPRGIGLVSPRRLQDHH